MFKVDQLAAWEEVSVQAIANCYRHTGLFGTDNFYECWQEDHNAEEQAVEKEQEEGQEDAGSKMCSAEMISKAEMLKAFSIVIPLVDVSDNEGKLAQRHLRKIQAAVRL